MGREHRYDLCLPPNTRQTEGYALPFALHVSLTLVGLHPTPGDFTSFHIWVVDMVSPHAGVTPFSHTYLCTHTPHFHTFACFPHGYVHSPRFGDARASLRPLGMPYDAFLAWDLFGFELRD